MRTSTATRFALIFLLAGSPVLAAESPLPRVLPAECELQLALSALPDHLRDGAAVFGFGESGHELAREGSNGFTCIVNRDDPYSIKPTCFDAEGTEAIVPKIVEVGRWLRAGRSMAEIQSELEQRFANGDFISPRRPGVAYMLSHYNRPYNLGTSQLGWFPPHLMFYAPNLTNGDIGFQRGAHTTNRSLPFIGYQGPHGYMIVLAEDPGERASLPGCPDWLEE